MSYLLLKIVASIIFLISGFTLKLHKNPVNKNKKKNDFT